MSLCINPEATEVRVSVNGGMILLKLKAASVDQSRKIRKSSGTPEMKRNKMEWRDNSNEAIIEVVDELLIDCGALDENGDATELTYNKEGVETLLTKDVEGWKSLISETVKLAAGREFFAVNAEIGGAILEN